MHRRQTQNPQVGLQVLVMISGTLFKPIERFLEFQDLARSRESTRHFNIDLSVSV
jgi:hypothetical protein